MDWEFIKKKVFLFSFFLVLLSALFSGITYLYVTSLPEYSVREAGVAIQENDWEKFNQYVYLEAILEKSSDSLIEEYMNQKNMSDNQKDRIRSTLKSHKPQIASFFESYVKSALFPNKSVTTSESPIISKAKSSPAPAPFNKNKLTLVDIQNKDQDSDTAILNLFFTTSEENNIKKVITLKLKKRSSYWQIVEITNISEIVRWPEIQNYLKQ